MRSGLFITGTGTDIGKTYVSALIVKHLRQEGLRTGYYKPVLSGTTLENGRVILGDAQYVTDVCHLPLKPEQVVSYHFEMAASPHLAAKMAGQTIELAHIQRDFARLQAYYDYLIVEGCGGVICPLADTQPPLMQSDVICQLGLDAVIVAPAGLGTINSTLLTLGHLGSRGLPVAAIILNGYDAEDVIHQDNHLMLEKMTLLPIYTVAKEPKSGLIF